MELKTSIWTVVWNHDLDKFIEHHLGRQWSLQQNSFFGQDTIQRFEVFPDPEATAKVQEWLDSDPAKCPGRINQAGFAEDVEIYTDTILSELCNRGLLPEGDLKVHVWW